VRFGQGLVSRLSNIVKKVILEVGQRAALATPCPPHLQYGERHTRRAKS
jgi:hypothetical protein